MACLLGQSHSRPLSLAINTPQLHANTRIRKSPLSHRHPHHTPSQAAAATPIATTLTPPTLLLGTWITDIPVSDMKSYERQLDLLQISGLPKITAMTLIEGIQLDTDSSSNTISLKFLTVVPFFKVVETYSLAQPSELSRRDLKSGKQRFKAQLLLTTTNSTNNDQQNQQPSSPLEEPTVLVVTSEWRDPNAGKLEERYELVNSNTLQCTSTLEVAAGSATSRRLFKRSTKGWTPKQRWNPLF